MKISQIITEQYENQDPNREPDEEYITSQYWYDTNGKLHRDDDLPAVIFWFFDGTHHPSHMQWYQHGILTRVDDKPTTIQNDRNGNISQQEWNEAGFQGKLHRETGPARIYANGEVEFWYDGWMLPMDEWAEKVGMRKHEVLMMKNKLGLH